MTAPEDRWPEFGDPFLAAVADRVRARVRHLCDRGRLFIEGGLPPLDWHHNGAILLTAVEKLKPTYDLASIQAEFSTVDGLRMTVTARNSAFALGLTLQGVVTLIQTITRPHFYKSMTSFADHTVWQDVYHVPHEGAVLYVKFTLDAEGHLVISLKEK